MTFKLFDEDFETVKRYAANRDYHKAIHYLASVSAKYKHANSSKRSAYHYSLGIYHSKAGDYKAADAHFNIAVADLSGNYQIAIERAISYLHRGDLREAHDILEDLEQNRDIRHSNLSRPFCMIKSRYHLLAGDYHAALQYGLEADRQDRFLNPTTIKETELAREYIRRNVSPLEGALRYALNLLHIDKQSKSDIKLSYIFLENFMKHLESPEDKLECIIALSHSAEKLGDGKHAKIYIERAIALSPNAAELRAERIRLSCKSLQPAEALRFYNQDKDIIKGNPNATIHVADTFYIASNTPSFGDLTQTFATIAGSLEKRLSKQLPIPTHPCPRALA
ncbi:MAG: hypothetical protein A3J37_08410 [Alphaproteobacteria bacterium RIFCSPHIGHO2_12_FULL_45_9]|nr:MAG: hypothetical protein A3B66_00535 [Alphaproteobacteria bacterium RIFCSPHIGHO2_02_FULL_46_13]OFW97148.1 MAG: hypothetical protein A3J37_08410 [Alphaproteobacteria bacterium RIFCSPHIGHO2_12_FULL_45_9]